MERQHGYADGQVEQQPHITGDKEDMDLYTLTLGQEVRSEVARQNLADKDVAAQAGISVSSYQRYFKKTDDKGISPTIETVAKVADAIGVDLVELLERVQKRIEEMKAQD